MNRQECPTDVQRALVGVEYYKTNMFLISHFVLNDNISYQIMFLMFIFHPPPVKNVPLRHERIRWKSDMPLTESQVRSKREEFWDTAPAFEGRREIWDALKAAALAIESHDYNLAQAIIDGANITLPNGVCIYLVVLTWMSIYLSSCSMQGLSHTCVVLSPYLY